MSAFVIANLAPLMFATLVLFLLTGFPVAFALKTTVPFLLLSVSALGWSLWCVIGKRDKRFLALLLPVA